LPVITSCTNKTAVEGTDVIWTCNASGSQPLTLSWFKGNNNTVISSGKTFNVSSSKRTDAGMYRFTVSNGDECPTASTSIYLTVQSSLPGIPTIQVQPDQRVWCQGNTVNVTCNITVGNPENINLTFYRNNEIIAVKHGTVNGNATKATVTIALTPGINSFSCKATNFTGSSENLTVTVKDPPIIIDPQGPDCRPLYVLENQDVTLVCNTTGEPVPSVTWTKDGVPLGSRTNDSYLLLQNVLRNQTGNYTCTADNGVGKLLETACWKLDVQCK
ncbi:hypothetical protein QZH41_011637, partial [Actinostola sp. cb2023]